jgi:hypothetical protein
MRQNFQLSNEEYARLVAYAARRNQTPETLFLSWLQEIIHQPGESFAPGTIKQMGEKLREQHKNEGLASPLSQVAGTFAIDDPGRADRHDEYLAATFIEDHAD